MSEVKAMFTKLKQHDNERGMVMLIVVMIMMGVSLLGLASLLVVGTDIRIAGQYKQSAQAFWAAEAGVQRTLGELRDNRDFTGEIDPEAMGNSSVFSANVTPLSGYLVRVVAEGRNKTSRRRIEVIINTDSAFESALNVGGDLTLEGKPRISSEGVRVNGDAYLDLDSGTPELNLYMPTDGTLNAEGDLTNLNRVEKEAMDLAAIKLKDTDWYDMGDMASEAFVFDNDSSYRNRHRNRNQYGFLNGDTVMTMNNLDFNDVPPGANGNRVIFVDGDLTLNGTIAGTGTIVTTGKIICTGGFVTSGTPTVTMIAKDDVMINFDTNAQSEINGLVYTEGDYELHGKIKFTGVVTAFGSVNVQNPSQFTNNSDPNYWYTYSPAYNILTDPIDILSWTEIEQ
jgi:hypothetical protein